MKTLGTQPTNEPLCGDAATAPILNVGVYVSNIAARRSQIPKATHLPSLEGRLCNKLIDQGADVSIGIVAALGDRILDHLAQGFELQLIFRAEFARLNGAILEVSQNGGGILLRALGPIRHPFKKLLQALIHRTQCSTLTLAPPLAMNPK